MRHHASLLEVVRRYEIRKLSSMFDSNDMGSTSLVLCPTAEQYFEFFSNNIHPIQGSRAPQGRGLLSKRHNLYGHVGEDNG